jgi:hypothetical protein
MISIIYEGLILFLFGLAWVYEKKAQSFLKNQNRTGVGFAIVSFMITKF